MMAQKIVVIGDAERSEIRVRGAKAFDVHQRLRQRWWQVLYWDVDDL